MWEGQKYELNNEPYPETIKKAAPDCSKQDQALTGKETELPSYVADIDIIFLFSMAFTY